MLHSRYIVVEDFPDDTSRVIYNGSSSIEAQKAMGESIERAKAQAVLYFAHPHYNQVRYPLQEKIDIQERLRQADQVRNADSVRKTKEAEAKRLKAKELLAQAETLEAQASAHLDAAPADGAPVTEPAGEPDSKPKNGKKKKSET